MPALALALVLSGAVLHAIWSLAAKAGSPARDPVGFIWGSMLIAAVVIAPLALWAAATTEVNWRGLLGGAVIAGLIQLGYFLMVQLSYAVGDVSVLYPMARGLGPTLSMLGAVIIFGERPGVVALLGGLTIVAGVLLITVLGSRGARLSPAVVAFGIATGVLIASYTLWDTFVMRELGSSPLLHIWIIAILETVLLTPVVLLRKRSALAPFRETRGPIVLAGLTTMASYVTILFAIKLAPTSLVAPLREMSVVLVSLAGWLLFKEPNPVPRIVGAGVVVIGGLLIAFG